MQLKRIEKRNPATSNCLGVDMRSTISKSEKAAQKKIKSPKYLNICFLSMICP